MKKSVKWLAALLLLGMCSAVLADGNKDKPVGNLGNPKVLPPGSSAYGKTYGEWGSAWWQWVLAQPASSNPLIDDTGAKVANGQSGEVWFLCGSWGSPTPIREASIPQGKALFFPIVNCECSSLEGPPWYGYDEVSLRECLKANAAYGARLVEIDGVMVNNLTDYYAMSPAPFTITVPEVDPLPGYLTGQGICMAEGFWIMLSPLSVGTHVIRFAAGDEPVWGFEVTYVLTVE